MRMVKKRRRAGSGSIGLCRLRLLRKSVPAAGNYNRERDQGSGDAGKMRWMREMCSGMPGKCDHGTGGGESMRKRCMIICGLYRCCI